MSNVPEMPSLNYRGVAGREITPMLQAAWIMLMVVGSLTVLGGLCVGGAFGMGVYLAASHSAARGPSPRGAMGMVALVGAVMMLIPLALGAVQMVCSLKLRRFSMAAAVVALTALGIEMVALLALAGLVVFAAANSRGGVALGAMVGAGFYVLLALVPAASGVLLFKALPAIRGRAGEQG